MTAARAPMRWTLGALVAIVIGISAMMLPGGPRAQGSAAAVPPPAGLPRPLSLAAASGVSSPTSTRCPA